MKGFKKLGVLVASLSLFAAVGCSNSNDPAPTPTPVPTPVVVPVTGITTTESGFSLLVGETHELVYTIEPTNATNKGVNFTFTGNAITIHNGVVEGIAEGDSIVTVTTVDGGFSVTYNITVKEPVEFPVSKIVKFFEDAGVEDVVVPDFAVASEDVSYETDTSFEGYFDVYVTGATHDEMVAYKDTLVANDWVVVGESEDGDFRLQFGETIAFVDLIDYGDYILTSFFAKTAVDYTAEEIATIFNNGLSPYGLAAEYYDIEDVFTGWYLGVSFGESDDDSEENLGSAVYTLAQFLPEDLDVYYEGYTPAEELEETPANYTLVLVSSGFSSAVEIYGYLDEGLLVSEIYIYDLN
jgi:hypothetical protein